MNITILAPDEIQYLARVLTQAANSDAPWHGEKVRISQQGGRIKIAVGAGMWTPDMGKPADASGQYPVQ